MELADPISDIWDRIPAIFVLGSVGFSQRVSIHGTTRRTFPMAVGPVAFVRNRQVFGIISTHGLEKEPPNMTFYVPLSSNRFIFWHCKLPDSSVELVYSRRLDRFIYPIRTHARCLSMTGLLVPCHESPR